MTPIKRNIIANYASQIYMAVIGIVLMPLYLRYMGAEAYGLIGFYSMLQGWFMLLDIGLTPTMIRETARFRGGMLDALTLRRFVRAIESIFYAVAILGAAAVMTSSHLIATDWLKVQTLPVGKVQEVIILMAVIMAMRWLSGLYKGAVNGFERLIWLGGFNVFIATLRFVAVVPVLLIFGKTPTVFFTHQVVIAVIELGCLLFQAYRLLPTLPPGAQLSWDFRPVKNVLGFSLTVAFTGSAWVAVTQTDKLLLSKFLPLSEYAYFTLAVLVASGINLLSGPISGALLPRMVKLQAEGNELEMVRLYRNATQLVAVIAIPAALVLAFFSRQILVAWTGNVVASNSGAPVLTLYALGNGILAISSFAYFIQFAKGDLKLHLIGSMLFVLVLIPTLIWGTHRYGMVGAGYAWLLANSLYLIFWVPLVHMRLVKGLHRIWLLNDVAAIVLLSSACAVLIRQFVRWPGNRASIAVVIALIAAILVVVAAAASSWVRQTVRQRSLMLRVSSPRS